MASPLAVGAGAGAGFEDLLSRIMLEDKMRQQDQLMEEARRHNMAGEDISLKSIESQDAYRRAQDAENQRWHTMQDTTRDDNIVRQEVALRPIGGMVSPQEKARETQHGIPEALYGEWQPGNMGMSTPEGEQPPTREGMPWSGTQDQINRAAQRKPDPRGTSVVHDTDRGLVRIYEDGTTEPVTDKDTGDVLKGYHAPPSAASQTAGLTLQMTDEGLQLVNKGTGTARPVKSETGGGLGPTLPAQERVRIDTAPKMAAHIDPMKNLINDLDASGNLGPVWGRWNDLLANKLGTTGDPDLDYKMGQLGFGMKGLISGFINIHAGARGAASSQLSQMWSDVMNAHSMSKERLFGALEEERSWLKTYGTGPDKQGQTPEAAPAQGNRVYYDANGNPIKR